MIVPFTIHDALKLSLQGDVDAIMESAKLMVRGEAFTLREDDRPLIAGGIIPLWDGVGEAWLMVDQAARSRPHTFARRVAFGLAFIQKKRGYRRIQAHADMRVEHASRFLEWLGFRKEGPMIGYLPDGGDAWRYAKIMGVENG